MLFFIVFVEKNEVQEGVSPPVPRSFFADLLEVLAA